jgi:hypothetical protein
MIFLTEIENETPTPHLTPDVLEAHCHRGSWRCPGKLHPKAKHHCPDGGSYHWDKTNHTPQPNQRDRSIGYSSG